MTKTFPLVLCFLILVCHIGRLEYVFEPVIHNFVLISFLFKSYSALFLFTLLSIVPNPSLK